MKFKQYTSVHEFYNDTCKVLLRHETQNMILLGNIILGHEGTDKTGWRDPVNWVKATVSNKEEIALTALMTPPHNITLYSTDNEMRPEALDCLIDGLGHQNIPGVTSDKALALAFAEKYTAGKGMTCDTEMNQRIYELKIINQDIKCQGVIRLAKNDDIHFFPYWLEAFYASVYGKTEMNIPEDVQEAKYKIDSRKMYILEVAGVPVSMAGFTRELTTAIGVAYVYTPPYFREKGYASSIVAQLSQLALDRGYKKCVLYTDLSNPISNSIYMKIGYVPVCDSLMLSFFETEQNDLSA